MNYVINIAGMERSLPLCPIGEDLCFAAFIMFGDVEITRHSAQKLLALAPEFDVIVTAEAKGIPLAYEMARQAGDKHYVIARKSSKLYMSDIVATKVKSISTDHEQELFISGSDAAVMRGKRILVVDDVISTGESLHALEALIDSVGGSIVGRMAVLAEGDAIHREDITYLAPLPLFDGSGNIKE